MFDPVPAGGDLWCLQNPKCKDRKILKNKWKIETERRERKGEKREGKCEPTSTWHLFTLHALWPFTPSHLSTRIPPQPPPSLTLLHFLKCCVHVLHSKGVFYSPHRPLISHWDVEMNRVPLPGFCSRIDIEAYHTLQLAGPGCRFVRRRKKVCMVWTPGDVWLSHTQTRERYRTLHTLAHRCVHAHILYSWSKKKHNSTSSNSASLTDLSK